MRRAIMKAVLSIWLVSTISAQQRPGHQNRTGRVLQTEADVDEDEAQTMQSWYGERLIPEDSEMQDEFRSYISEIREGAEVGKAVAISPDGKYIIAGADRADVCLKEKGSEGYQDSCTRRAGAAYIFRQQGGGEAFETVSFIPIQKLVSGVIHVDQYDRKTLETRPIVDEKFGYSVAISEDTAVVGAPGFDSYSGAIYIFYKDSPAADEWGLVQTFTAEIQPRRDFVSNCFGCWYGRAVGVLGDLMLVGAPGFTKGSAIEQRSIESGAVYVYSRVKGSNSNWRAYQYSTNNQIVVPDYKPNDYFGVSIHMQGNRSIIGASGAAKIKSSKVGSVTKYTKVSDKTGAAYIFDPGSTTKDDGYTLLSDSDHTMPAWKWIKLTADNMEDKAHSGKAVALYNDLAVVGSPGFNGTRGAVCIFELKNIEEFEVVNGTRITVTRFRWIHTDTLRPPKEPNKDDYLTWEVVGGRRVPPTTPTIKFGEAVAVTSQYAFIGAPRRSVQQPELAWKTTSETKWVGSVFVFNRIQGKNIYNATPTELYARRDASHQGDMAEGDLFASSVSSAAGAGDGVVVAGAIGKEFSAGAVYFISATNHAPARHLGWAQAVGLAIAASACLAIR